MTNEEYRAFLTDEIKSLTEMIQSGGNATAVALLICEKNRLVDKLFEVERKTAPVAFKIGNQIIGGSSS